MGAINEPDFYYDEGICAAHSNSAGADTQRYYSDGVDPMLRSTPDELFLLTIEARPMPGVWENRGQGGSFASCLVDADDLRIAERRAVALLREGGWRPYRFDRWVWVDRATYADNPMSEDGRPDMREVVNDAFLDGAAVIHSLWPADAPTGDAE